MSHKHFSKFNVGLVIASVGVGVVMAVVFPIWGWIIVGGAALIYAGWYLIEKWDH